MFPGMGFCVLSDLIRRIEQGRYSRCRENKNGMVLPGQHPE